MKITYLYNSGFCIEFEDAAIIIDFYKDTKDIDGFIYTSVLPQTKKIYVLCTHSHLDHFNREIFHWKWKNENSDITYILFKDILDSRMASAEEAHYLDKFETWADENIKVKAYGSTDVGGSFYIEAYGKRIFHAGDLNNWHWNEESPDEEIKESEDFFARELADVSRDIKELDIAFFPVDPRLGKDFMKGAEQFIEAIKVGLFIPMHFQEEYKKISQFNEKAEQKGVCCWSISERGESINVK